MSIFDSLYRNQDKAGLAALTVKTTQIERDGPDSYLQCVSAPEFPPQKLEKSSHVDSI